jgi:hypothetical protein
MDQSQRAMLLRDLVLSRENIFQVFRVDHGKRSDYRKVLSSPSRPRGRGGPSLAMLPPC